MTRIVMVRQFLKSGMADEFDAAFSLHRELASAQTGFIALRRFDAGPERFGSEVLVVAEFETEAHLRAWRASEAHAVLAKKYQALWSRDPVTEFFSARE